MEKHLAFAVKQAKCGLSRPRMSTINQPSQRLHPILQLQRTFGNRAIIELIGSQRLTRQGMILRSKSGGPDLIHRSPSKPAAPQPPSPHADPDLIDKMLADLHASEDLLKLGVKEMASEPLTSQEMYELLLIRRAEPLSIPASMVNEADQRISAADARIAVIDKEIQKAIAETKNVQKQSKALRGSGKDVAKLEVKKLQAQTEGLQGERKKLLSEKVRISRGQRMGTPGEGAPAGTGQLTYAAIQVVDAKGKRIAVELSTTTTQEHAEEQIVGRLRAMKPEDLKGARILVVTDQKVCKARCQKALIKFAQDFGIELVESRYFQRSRLDGKGEASPRTTLVTATKASSANLPVVEKTEEIYRRSGSTASSADALPSPTTTRQTQPGDSNASEGAVPSRTVPTTDDDNVIGPRSPKTEEELPLPVRLRARAAMEEVGGNLVADIVIDLLMSWWQKRQSGAALRERLKQLQSSIDSAKRDALEEFLHDPWANTRSTADGFYYNVYLRISWKTTTVIGGGRAVVFPPSPHPYVQRVKISKDNLNANLSDDQSVKVPGIKDGATGAMVEMTDTQYVVYSQAL